MRFIRNIRLFIFIAFMIAILAEAALSIQSSNAGPVRDIPRDAGIRALFEHRSNNVGTTISNWGEFGNPDGVPGYLGFEYTIRSENDFLFSAGLWVGALVDDEPYVSTGTDGDNGTNEFAPSIDRFVFQSNLFDEAPFYFSLIGFDDDGDWDRDRDDLNHDGVPSLDWDGPDRDANGDGIFFYDPEPHIDEDPPGDISHDLLDNDHDGLVDEDDDDWDGDERPDSDDDDGDGEVDEDGAAMAGQQLLAIYDDTDTNEVRNPDNDGHHPLDIRVEQRTYSWNIVDSPTNDVLVTELIIRNIGETTLENVHFGLFADPDIGARGEGGDPASLDDWNFYDVHHLMAIQGDDTTDNDEQGPGVFAMKILSTPSPLDEIDVVFKNFERVSGGDPDLNRHKYDMISDDPDNSSPPTDELGDWRFLIGFGSADDDWQMEPGEILEVAFAFIGAEDIAEVIETAEEIQEFYDEGLQAIFQLDYMPCPVAPRVEDTGTGNSLLVTVPHYGQFSPVGGLKVHYGNLDEEEVVDIERTTEVVIEELNEGVEYYIAVSLYDRDGEDGQTSDTTWMTPLSVPRKPRDLAIDSEGFHEINLSWQANQELDIAGYNLYRASDGEHFELVQNEPIDDNFYTDQIDNFAIYTYRLSAVDDDGNESDILGAGEDDIPVAGAPFILEDGRILLVDETRHGNGRPGSPSDDECDDFYHEVLDGFEYDELDYEDFYDENRRALTAREIGLYQVIIWHGDAQTSISINDNLDILAGTIEYGGRLLVSGWNIFEDRSGLDTLVFADGSLERFVFNIERGIKCSDREFIATAGLSGFPDLQVNGEKLPERWDGCMSNIWSLQPAYGEEIYLFASIYDQSPFMNSPCGIKYWNTIVLGFPLYFMETEGVREFFEIAIPELLGASDSDENAVPVEFRLLQNYPNPFNSTTTIRYELPVHGQVSLQLYNILGQQITTLFEGHRQAGFHSVSLTVSDLSSGLYFVKLNAGGQVFTRKVMLIK